MRLRVSIVYRIKILLLLGAGNLRHGVGKTRHSEAKQSGLLRSQPKPSVSKNKNTTYLMPPTLSLSRLHPQNLIVVAK